MHIYPLPPSPTGQAANRSVWKRRWFASTTLLFSFIFFCFLFTLSFTGKAANRSVWNHFGLGPELFFFSFCFFFLGKAVNRSVLKWLWSRSITVFFLFFLQAKPRIGAFEVTLVWVHNSFSYRVLLYSKLTSRLPTYTYVCTHLHTFVCIHGVCINAQILCWPPRYTHTHTHTHTHTFTHTHSLSLSLTHTDTHSHTLSHTNTDTQTHTLSLTHRLFPNVGSLVANLRDVLPNRKDQVSVKVLTNSTHQAIPDAHIIIQVACAFFCILQLKKKGL